MPSFKRIIFIHIFNNYSGSPRVLKDTIEAINNDQQYLLLTSKGPGILDRVSNKKCFNYRWSSNKIMTLINFIYAQLYIFFYIIFFSNKDDLIFINTMQPTIAAIAAKLKGLPIIIHIHELHSSQKIFGKVYYSIRKWIKAREIFVSNFIATKENIAKTSSSVIHNPISNEFLNSSQNFSYTPIQEGIFNVLMICSLRDYKGIPELLDLCQNVKDISNISFSLLLDATENEISKHFSSIVIPSNLKIYPRTDNPGDFYRKASLLLNLSRPDQWIETFGLTIVEAMAYGIPCIVPRVGGPLEIVDDDVNGFHISCYEQEKLALTVKFLADNVSECLRLSENARKKSKLFTMETYQNKINNFINEC